MGTVLYNYHIPTIDKRLSYDEYSRLHPEETITVADLIAKLKEFPQDMIVCQYDGEFDSTYPINDVSMGELATVHGIYSGVGGDRILTAREWHTCEAVVIK